MFAGAGGLLNLCTSLWYRDKQTEWENMWTHHNQPREGDPSHLMVISLMRIRIILRDGSDGCSSFALIKVLFLVPRAHNTYIAQHERICNAYIKGLVPEGLNIAVVQAHIFGDMWEYLFRIFLVMSFLMLFSVM